MKRGALLALVIALPCSFARSVEAAPTTSREICEAALAQEEHGSPTAAGRQACHDAMVLGGSAQDMRNWVATLLSPGAHPSLDDLAKATLAADAALAKSPDQPWPYLARCDIARRTGNADTLEECLKDLRRFGADNPATKQALAFASKPSSWGIWVMRILVIVVLFGSLAHGLLSRRRGARSRIPSPVVMGLMVVGAWCLLSGFLSRAVLAEWKGKDHLSTRFTVDDADPESSVPTPEQQAKQPLEFGYWIQDLLAKAEHAEKAGDKEALVRFYSALTKATPTAYAPSKLCSALEAVGDLPKAIGTCRTALTRPGSTAQDYIHFVNVVLASHDPLPKLENQELKAVMDHLAKEVQLGAELSRLRCEVALRFDDTPALKACSAELAQSAPSDVKTVSYQWALALRQHDRWAALKMIDRARSVGMSAEGLSRMEAGTRQMTNRMLLWLTLSAMAAIVAVIVFRFGRAHFAANRLQRANRPQAAA